MSYILDENSIPPEDFVTDKGDIYSFESWTQPDINKDEWFPVYRLHSYLVAEYVTIPMWKRDFKGVLEHINKLD